MLVKPRKVTRFGHANSKLLRSLNPERKDSEALAKFIASRVIPVTSKINRNRDTDIRDSSS